MKHILAFLVAAVGLGFFHLALFSQTSEPMQTVESAKKEILALDQQVNDAAVNGDVKLFAKVMSDDYVGVAPNGMILRKPMIAAHYQAGTLHYESVVNSETEVQAHDDCAILTAVSNVKGHDGDIDLSGKYRIMRVFLRRNGEWQIVGFQATPIRP
jgi:ketosteroid isomerase-like protein